MIYENNPARPGYVPFPEPHHVRQPYPYPVPPRHMSDLEPAFVVRPGEECCPGPQPECECVTSGDVMRWNHAADITESLTEEQIAGLSSIPDVSEIVASASAWNSCYDTVSANSADWEEIRKLSSFSADTLNKFDEIESAFDNVNENISAVEKKIPDYHFDVSGYFPSMTGDGSIGAPYGVKDWQSYANLRTDLNDIYSHIIEIPASDGYAKRWIFDGTKAYVTDINTRFSAVDERDSKQDENIEHLWDELSGAKKYAQSALNEVKTYLPGHGISILPYSEGETNEYVIAIKPGDLDYVIHDQVKEIATETTNDILNGKRYVEFVKLSNYPKTTADIINSTANKTIYVAV